MREIPVTMVGDLNGHKVEFNVGEASHLQFDRGTHTVHIQPEETTERILLDVSLLGIQELLRTRAIRKMKIDFELEEPEQGEDNDR